MRTVVVVLCALFSLSARGKGSNELTRAVFAQERLWMRTEDGALRSLAPGEKRTRVEQVPGRVLDVCVLDGAPTVVTGDGKNWTVRRRDGTRWQVSVAVDAKGDTFLAMGCAGEPILVSDRRLVFAHSERSRAVELSEPIKGGLTMAVHATPTHVYVGRNIGEWGGGLQRIDRQTGAVRLIDEHPDRVLCGGPLNAKCDPVHAIAEAPWDASCIVVAIGLRHMSAHGRLVEVCGDEIRTVYAKAIDDGENHRWPPDFENPYPSVAFFGLVRSGPALWAVGSDGLYRMTSPKIADHQPLPKPTLVGGEAVSFADPRFALVWTRVNQHAALSGSVPLLTSR